MHVSKRNRRGLIWLLVVALVVVVSPRIVAKYLHTDLGMTIEEYRKTELQVLNNVGDKTRDKSYSAKKPRKYTAPKAAFDPNTYKVSDWMKLGLSEKQSVVITRFADRGIKSNEELQKIFVIDENLFELIKDSTFYPIKKKEKDQVVVLPKIIPLELNSATEEELIELPGIGSYYAKKIVDYRKQLGGYVQKDQLKEIWKFDDEKFNKLKDRVVVNGDIKRININTASIEELKAHPYIDYKVANSIVKYRIQHGNYKQVDDLKQLDWITNELFVRIKEYLKVE